jgi:hypothetical protein
VRCCEAAAECSPVETALARLALLRRDAANFVHSARPGLTLADRHRIGPRQELGSEQKFGSEQNPPRAEARNGKTGASAGGVGRVDESDVATFGWWGQRDTDCNQAGMLCSRESFARARGAKIPALARNGVGDCAQAEGLWFKRPSDCVRDPRIPPLARDDIAGPSQASAFPPLGSFGRLAASPLALKDCCNP